MMRIDTRDLPLPLDEFTGDPEGWLAASFHPDEDDRGWFEEAYRFLRVEMGLRKGPAFLTAWLSVRKDDRGDLKTMEHVARILGVSRKTLYTWKKKYILDEYADQLRVLRMRGNYIGEVDKAVYNAAIDGAEGKAADRRLFYERAGVLDDNATILDRRTKEKADRLLEKMAAIGKFEERK